MTTASWMTWAMLSAVFAALTAVFAKLGVNRRAQVQEVAARLGLLESASADP